MGNIVLIGGSGFLGPIILKNFPNILSVGRSRIPAWLSNKHIFMPDVNHLSILDDVDIDYVIFLVGSSDHHLLNGNSTLAIEKNVLPLKTALDYFSNRKIKKFISLTTMLLYDAQKMIVPVDESTQLNPYLNNYVFSKFMAEELSKMYLEKVPNIVIRISNVYGPTHLRRPDIVPTIIHKILDGERVIHVWNMSPIRDFIFADDAALAIYKLLHSNFTGVVNLGTGVGSSVRDLCSIITKLSGVEFVDDQRDVWGHMKFIQDITQLKKLVDVDSFTNLYDGLEKTYIQMKKKSYV